MKYLRKCCEKLAWFPPLLLRLVLATVFLTSGWYKATHLDEIVGFFRTLGIPLAGVQAPFVTGVELMGGACLCMGLLTRFAAVPLAATMIVALLTAKRADIEGLSSLLETAEFLYLVMLIAVMKLGGGTISLDHFFCRFCRVEKPIRQHSS